MEIGLRPRRIAEGAVGQEFVTKFGKVIQVVAMSPRKVRVLVLATDEEVEVAPDYPVYDPDVFNKSKSGKDSSSEEECEECASCEEQARSGDEEEPEVEESGEAVIEAALEEEAEETVQAAVQEQQSEPEVPEPAKMRVSAQSVTEKAEKPKAKKPAPKAIKKAAPKKKEVKVKKATPKPAGEITTKQLIVNLLMKGPQTREALAQAVVDAKLSKNGDVKKVKSYVSIILHALKKTNKNFVSLGPGKYEIKK